MGNIHTVNKNPSDLIDADNSFTSDDFIIKIENISNELKGLSLIDSCSLLDHVKLHIHRNTKV